jgi:hypothetical protein
MVWLDGEQDIPVYQWDGIWNLAQLTPPGQVVAWTAFTNRPQLPPWPLVAVASRSYYRSRNTYPGQRQP